MSHYSFLVNWSPEDQVYVATCPEFDGVSGFGETQAEALAEAQMSLALAIETYQEEGWALPAQRERAEYSGQFRMRVSRTMHRRLAQRAEEEGVSLNTLASTLFERGLATEDVRDVLRQELMELRSLNQRAVRPTGSSAVLSAVPVNPPMRSTATQIRREN